MKELMNVSINSKDQNKNHIILYLFNIDFPFSINVVMFDIILKKIIINL